MQNNYPDYDELKRQSEREEEILERATKRISDWFSYYSANITRGQDDARFTYETQFTNQEIAELGRLGKKVAQFNKVYPLIQKRVSQYREATPSLAVYPENSYVPDQKIELINNLLDSRLEASNADVIFQNCYAQSLTRGYSALAVYTDYDNNHAFQQDIYVMGFQIPESAFFDPNASNYSKSDGDFSGYYVYMSRDQFKQEYPDLDIDVSRETLAPYNSYIKWVSRECVAVCYYYEKQYYDTTIYQISARNGDFLEEIEEKEYKDRVKENTRVIEYAKKEIELTGMPTQETLARLENLPSIKVLKKRKKKKFRIKGYKLIHNKILEETDWPIDLLPVIYWDGESYYLDGKQKTLSNVYHLRDPQRVHNYAACEQLTGMAAARKEQFLLNKEHLTGDKNIDDAWRNPENIQGALIYNTPSNPRTPAIPTRLDPVPLNPSFAQLYQISDISIQQIGGSTQGMDNLLANGKLGPESGDAVAKKQALDDLVNYSYVDNGNRAIEQVGRVILKLIPKIYDSQRTVTVKTKTGDFNTIELNKMLPSGKIKNNVLDLDNKLNVKIKLAPPSQLKKQVSFDQLVKLISVDPRLGGLILDIVAGDIDSPQANQIVKRIRDNLIPPEVLAKENGEDPANIPPPKPPMEQILMEKELEQQDKKLQLQEMQIQLEAEKQRMEQQQAMVKAQLEQQKIQSGAAQMVVDQFIAEKRANAEITKAEVDADMHALTTLTKLANAKKDSTVSG